MLRDYELALSNYRLISTDYKLDKAWKRYAAVQEMMGAAYFMLNHSWKESEHCMENAFNTYLKNVPAGHQNATRCGLWWVEMLKTRDQFKEAAGVYFLIAGEESLHSAVMLEQASYCYLYSKPPMLRKYGFHLVLSGNQYKKSDQIKHAIRTYRRAVSVFKGTTWSYIKDHVHFHIGQWYAFLGLYDAAVIHMLEVLMCSHQSKTTQELFFKNFLNFFQKTGKACELLKLPLPIIDASSLKVVFEDHRTYASSAAVSVTESLWRSFEEEVIPSLSTARTNWLEVQSKFTSRRPKESNICVVGEIIEVGVEFKNPLQISIPLTGISLICELSERSDDGQTDANITGGMLNDQDSKLAADRLLNSSASVVLSDVDCVLEGGSTTMVKLIVTPREEGILKIVGVKWKISGSVSGCYNFVANPMKKKTTTRTRKHMHSFSDNLKFAVIKSLPKLEGLIHSIPERVYAGELRYLTLELSNKSEVAVKNLKMKISHPRFLNFGSAEHFDINYPACLQKITGSKRSGPMPMQREGSDSVFLFPNDNVIRKGSSLSWPLWFHAAVPGSVSLYIVLYYEIEDIECSMKYRTLRMFHNMEVLPAIDVSFQLSPQPSTPQKFLVRMDVTNQTSSEDFQMDQLSSLGNQWEISMIDPLFHPPLLMSGQAFSCFFMLKRHEKSGDSEEISSLHSPIGGDVKLSTKDDDDSLFDVSLSPLSDFHNCERLYQEKQSEGGSHTVDFILISHQVHNKNNPGVSHSPCFLSNHACHCSILGSSPISWVIDGPHEIFHDFSASFCEVSLKMTLYNSSKTVASIRINTMDSSHLGDSGSVFSNQEGWYNVPLENAIKVTSDVRGTILKSLLWESAHPTIWSASSSTKLQLGPGSMAEIPLQVCVFCPGTYDLSNYAVQWNLQPLGAQQNPESRPSSGTCPGYPYYLTVISSS
ncbi:hypothetical protein SAY86_005848 [Trapa natans]|uniref:Trafficking protein particle complex subunit 8 n=1 Tax=Trapa natans TaxID=22666 RepID=A0AAN7L8R7_TRANT|nr:hypothetical protein SAY86_005848 [Trapa natans]